MPDSVLSQLLDFGALGIFATFLIWQHLGMQKRLDKLTGSFQQQLKEIDDAYDVRLDKLRDRYDAVIKTMRDEADIKQQELLEVRTQIHSEVVSKLDAALEKLDTGLNEMRVKYAEERAFRKSRPS